MGDRGHNRHGPKRGGLLCPFRGGLGPRLIQCGLGRGLYSILRYQVASSSIQPFGHNRHGPKIGWGGCVFYSGGSCVPIEHKLIWDEAYLHTKWHLSPSSRLATTDIGRKLGELCPFRGGEAGSPSNKMSRRPRPTSVPSGILIHAAVWPQQTWAENWGGSAPFGEGGAGSPSNTKSPGLSPTFISSGILMHPTAGHNKRAENWGGFSPLLGEGNWVVPI